jgi:hypothetical protein
MYFYFFVVLEMEPRASHILSMCLTTVSHLSPVMYILLLLFVCLLFLLLRQGLTM